MDIEKTNEHCDKVAGGPRDGIVVPHNDNAVVGSTLTFASMQKGQTAIYVYDGIGTYLYQKSV